MAQTEGFPESDAQAYSGGVIPGESYDFGFESGRQLELTFGNTAIDIVLFEEPTGRLGRDGETAPGEVLLGSKGFLLRDRSTGNEATLEFQLDSRAHETFFGLQATQANGLKIFGSGNLALDDALARVVVGVSDALKGDPSAPNAMVQVTISGTGVHIQNAAASKSIVSYRVGTIT